MIWIVAGLTTGKNASGYSIKNQSDLTSYGSKVSSWFRFQNQPGWVPSIWLWTRTGATQILAYFCGLNKKLETSV